MVFRNQNILCVAILISFVMSVQSKKCFSPDQYPGECTPLSNCKSLLNLRHRSSQTEADRIYVTRSLCGGLSNGEPLVCCSASAKYVQGSGEQAPSTFKPQWIKTTQQPKTTPPTPFSRAPANLKNNVQCATVDNFSDNRIFGGVETRINELPFTAVIGYSRVGAAPNFGFFCGGVLVSQRSILTAAHCVHERILGSKRWTLRGVRLGEWNLDQNPDCDSLYGGSAICAPPAVDMTVERTIVHPEFFPFTKEQYNDIAVIQLNGFVNFNEFIKPICFPETSFEQDFDDVQLIVAGFGKTELSPNSQIKLKTDLRGMSNSKCQQTYDHIPIVSEQMCALGDFGKDSCNGDSGQALLYVNARTTPVRWEIVGLVSFGPSPCGQANKPGVYTRVSSYMQWIRQNVI